MTHQFTINNTIYFLSVRTNLLDMTINNPIFIFAVITVIWFIPGIVVKRIAEKKEKQRKERIQAKAIDKLYPKD